MARAWVRPSRQGAIYGGGVAAARRVPGRAPKFSGMIMSSASPPHPNVSGQQSGRRHPAVMRMHHQMVTPGGQTPMTGTYCSLPIR